MSEQSAVNSETLEKTKQQIRALASEISQLSRSGLQPAEFYPAFLDRVVKALAAVGGAIWVTEGRQLKVAYHIRMSDTLLDPESEEAGQHVRLLANVANAAQPQLVPPLSGAADEAVGGNPTRYLLVLCPLQSEGKTEGVVEIFQRPDTPPDTQRGYLRFLSMMCESVGDWLKSHKLKQYSDRHSLWAQADHFARLVHDNLELRETAYTVVNEGRRMIGCDRVSVAIKRGRHCKVEAISGQDTIENRSNIVHAIGRLASKVVATGEPLWYEGSTDDLPPQIEKAIDHYVEESYAKSVTVLPLRRPDLGDTNNQPSVTGELASVRKEDREIIGAMIIEQIETDLPREVLLPRIDLVYEHTARAVSNSLSHHNLFLMPVWRTLGKAAWVIKARTLPKTLAISGLIAAAIAALCLFPWDFNMKSRGTLQPVERQTVYTNMDGEIREVFVRHGQLVEAGDLLAKLHNVDLEVRIQDSTGRLDELGKQLDSTRARINRLPRGDDSKLQLGGEIKQIQAELASVAAEMTLLRKKELELEIRAPIAGEVITWDVRKKLQNRPVMQGNSLLEIAKPDAAWELVLDMPERRIGHVLAAKDELPADEKMKVLYILTTDPSDEKVGQIREIDPRTQTQEEEGQVVRLRVDIDKQELEHLNPRPGTTVTAKVRCGKRPIGYCWFHGAWEWLQKNVLF